MPIGVGAFAYTATPFANIFINPEAYDEDVYDELFPRDFIYCLDAPNTYFGPNAVFLDEVRSSEIVESITDCEEYLPLSLSLKKDHNVFELPPSLYRAINQFIVARAIRNLRGQANKHCSMMVNVSRFVDVQKLVRDLISIYEKKLREAVKANYAMPEKVRGAVDRRPNSSLEHVPGPGLFASQGGVAGQNCGASSSAFEFRSWPSFCVC